jgi:hypothetical protein
VVLGHTGWAVGAEVIRGAPRVTLGEEVRRDYARDRVRVLVQSCGSGDVVVEAPLIPKERRSAENELFQKGSAEG